MKADMPHRKNIGNFTINTKSLFTINGMNLYCHLKFNYNRKILALKTTEIWNYQCDVKACKKKDYMIFIELSMYANNY